MNDLETPADTPIIKRSRAPSPIWLVPIIAIAIGAWLLFHTLDQQGPTVAIEFKHAEGLEADKTNIKYKNVDIGVVKHIRLSSDLENVIVSAELVKDAEQFTRSDTRFWVVRPRIDRAGVSGLGTLVSGPYIAVDPGKSDRFAQRFTGLDSPPVITGSVRGRRYILEAERRGSLSLGSPVYLRDIQVGEVSRIELREDEERLEIEIFVNAPYVSAIHPTTRFWNASGIELSVNADGVDVEIASLESLISGGIAFETRDDSDEIAPEGARFKLFDSRNQIDAFGFTEKIRYVMYFDGSVRGLTPGAPVEFRGIKIGAVIRINAEFDPEKRSVRIPVVVDIEPQRIDRLLQDFKETEKGRENFETLIDLGLRAQLQTGSLITGKLFVSLDFHPDIPAVYAEGPSKYPEIPTVPTVFGQFEDATMALLGKLQKIPVEQISADILAVSRRLQTILDNPAIGETFTASAESAQKLGKLVERIETQVVPKIENAVGSYDENSPLYRQLVSTLDELERAADSVRELAEEIERAPESVIRGKR